MTGSSGSGSGASASASPPSAVAFASSPGLPQPPLPAPPRWGPSWLKVERHDAMRKERDDGCGQSLRASLAPRTPRAKSKKKTRVFRERNAGDARRRRAAAPRPSGAARDGRARRLGTSCVASAGAAHFGSDARYGGRRRETHPLPERSARSRGRPSPSRGLRRSELRGRERPPSVPTTSPSNSRGARGARAPPVRLAPPAGPEYDPQGRHGGSETDGGNNQGFGDHRGSDVIRRASRVPAFRSSRIGRRVRVAASGTSERIDRGRSRRCGKGVEHAPDLSACLAGLAAAGLAAACAGARATGLGPSSSSRRANMFAPEKAMALGSNGAFGERLVP